MRKMKLTDDQIKDHIKRTMHLYQLSIVEEEKSKPKTLNELFHLDQLEPPKREEE